MLRNHSHYSLLLSTSRCEQIVDACANYGSDYAGLTDLFTVAGTVKFIKACKSKDIKPIIGCDVILDDGSYLTLICRNIFAWKQLLRLISKANSVDNYKNGPKISFEDLLANISPLNFVVIDGYINSMLFSQIFHDIECVMHNVQTDSDSLAECMHNDYIAECQEHVRQMQEIFPNYYLELSRSESSFIVENILHDVIKHIDPEGKITIPDTSSYYIHRDDSVDHRVLLCSKLKTTLNKLDHKIYELKDVESLRFIKSSNYFIKNLQDDKNLRSIIDLCEPLDILSQPKFPTFNCPNGNQGEYLKDLCRNGWRKLIAGKIPPEKIDEYKDRVIHELGVIDRAQLSGYFLIVQDYVNHFRNKGVLVGPARGSAAGSLVCYLIGITLIDPIKYDLVFSRFYNEGRNTEDHVSLPDIDVDFPPQYRDEVINYLRDKYGHDKVCQMVTFGRLSGKSILKEVLRINESCSFDQMNRITEFLPNESAVSDQMEDSGETSIIRWTLEHKPEILADYCRIDNDELKGDFAYEFKQAIRMEGIYKTQGRHAAGVVVSSEALNEICPMVKASSSSDQIAGMEMGHLEAIGCVKFDILGVAILSKISKTMKEYNEENN